MLSKHLHQAANNLSRSLIVAERESIIMIDRCDFLMPGPGAPQAADQNAQRHLSVSDASHLDRDSEAKNDCNSMLEQPTSQS